MFQCVVLCFWLQRVDCVYSLRLNVWIYFGDMCSRCTPHSSHSCHLLSTLTRCIEGHFFYTGVMFPTDHGHILSLLFGLKWKWWMESSCRTPPPERDISGLSDLKSLQSLVTKGITTHNSQLGPTEWQSGSKVLTLTASRIIVPGRSCTLLAKTAITHACLRKCYTATSSTHK